MKKLDLNQTVSLLANIGVIAGIIFLAIEIRQNTVTQKMNAAQQVLGLSYTNGMVSATDRSLSEAVEIAASGSELGSGQQGQVASFNRAVMTANWQAYFLHQNGFIDDDFFEAYEERTKGFIRQPFATEWWSNNKSRYPRDFQAWVDEIVEEAPTR
jgi:hypothetical protein